ncbi:MAG: hypothetical protein KDE27_10055 [Planctomycetes bacterium]|nr:hypothetical protein [Planctomycetota bacterium]
MPTSEQPTVPPPPSGRSAMALVALALLPAVAIGVALQVWLWPLFAEDAFIVLRYSANLVAGNGLCWNVGDPVEGYSNLLWILACAAPMALGIDGELAARGLGALCMLAAGLVIVRLRPPRAIRDVPAAATGPAVLAAASTTVTWTLGGLEGPLVVLLLALALSSTLRLCRDADRPTFGAAARAGIPFALLCLARSDGPLWLAVPCAVLWFRYRRAGLAAFAAPIGLALPAVVAVLGHLAFRLAYYGEWLPNTAYLKAQVSWRTWTEGATYLAGAFEAARGILPLAVGGLVVGLAMRKRAVRTWLVAGGVPLWCLYMAAIGGDYFPSFRLFVPVVLLLALLAAELVDQLALRRPWLATGALALTIAALVYDTVTDPMTRSLRDSGVEWKNLELGRVLGRAFRSAQPLVAVDAAGGMPYASELPHVDMLGFNDATIARTPIQPFVYAAVEQILHRYYVPGHMKGNGTYVLDRRPDLVLFCSAPCTLVPMFASGYEMEDDPRWLAEYRCAMLSLPPVVLPNGLRETMRVPTWVRLEGRAGIRRAEGLVELPGVLLGSYRQPCPFRMMDIPAEGTPERGPFERAIREQLAWLAAPPILAVPGDDTVHAEIVGREPGRCRGVRIEAGRWLLEIEPSDAAVEVRLLDAAGVPLDPNGAEFRIANSGEFDFEFQATEHAKLPVRLDAARFRRVP